MYLYLQSYHLNQQSNPFNKFYTFYKDQQTQDERYNNGNVNDKTKKRIEMVMINNSKLCSSCIMQVVAGKVNKVAVNQLILGRADNNVCVEVGE